MCGICFIKRIDGKPASKLVERRYQNQKERGSEGFGYVSIKNGHVENYRRCETEKGIIKRLEAENAEEVLFHHRFPTSTPNFKQSAHPIKVSNAILKYDYYFVHNGIISNDDELKEKHNRLGFKYTTEIEQKYRSEGNTIFQTTMWNDSESLAIEFALDIEHGKNGIETVKGSIAFIALQVDKKTKKIVRMFYGRNAGNPLKQEVIKDQFIALTSDGYGSDININRLYSVDYADNKVEDVPYMVGKYAFNYTGYNYSRYDDYDDERHEAYYQNTKKESETCRIPFDIDTEAVINDLEWELAELETQILTEEDENEVILKQERIDEIYEELIAIDNEYTQKILEKY